MVDNGKQSFMPKQRDNDEQCAPRCSTTPVLHSVGFLGIARVVVKRIIAGSGI